MLLGFINLDGFYGNHNTVCQVGMMEHIIAHTQHTGCRFVAGTAVALVLSVSAALSQDLNQPTPSFNDRDRIAALQNNNVTTGFEHRWSNVLFASAEYVLGSDGIIKRGPEQDAASDTDALQKVYFGTPSSVTGSFERSQKTRPSAPHPTGSVAECGPSPLTVEEIKTLVAATARKHGIDTSFALAIAWAESRFDEARNSPKGARGPMQLIPATAARFGVKDICDPAQNIEGGMKYLRVLFDQFQNPLLVAAAYNSGEGRIYEHGGVPPYHETVGYVAKVVNFQLGLPMPAPKSKPGAANRAVARSSAQDPAKNPKHDAGVIAVQKTGTFVGGVMHF